MTLSLALGMSEGTAHAVAELRAEAEARMEAEDYIAAGELYLKLADLEGVVRRDEMFNAHSSFEAAYLTLHEPPLLCRALMVAEAVVRAGEFNNDAQIATFWDERVASDLDRLKRDAAETKRANCRYGASGRPRVALLTDADMPAPDAPSPSAHEDDEATVVVSTSDATPGPVLVASATGTGEGEAAGPSPAQLRRGRAHTIAGAIFTTAGIGLLGGLAGVIRLEAQRVAEMDGMVRSAIADGRKFTAAEDRRFGELKGDLLRGVGVGVGVGVVGIATLATGIAVLATRKRAMRKTYALEPYGTLQGAGAILRWNF